MEKNRPNYLFIYIGLVQVQVAVKFISLTSQCLNSVLLC